MVTTNLRKTIEITQKSGGKDYVYSKKQFIRISSVTQTDNIYTNQETLTTCYTVKNMKSDLWFHKQQPLCWRLRRYDGHLPELGTLDLEHADRRRKE